jgi:hypothetical protein
VAIKALSGRDRKVPAAAVAIPKTKPVETELKAAPKITLKPLLKINRIRAKPMAIAVRTPALPVKPLGGKAIKPAAIVRPKTKPVTTKAVKKDTEKHAEKNPPPTIKVVTQKPKVKNLFPAPKKQELQSRIVEPAELGYDAVERAREIETQTEEELVEGPYPVITEQDSGPGVEGPG